MALGAYFNRPAADDRLGLLDAARAVALIAMATYHFSWDLEFFGYLEPGTATHGPLKLYARAIATTFLFLAGGSLALAHGNGFRRDSFRRRLVQIVAAAALITIATRFATPEEFIYFGILHAIALFSIAGLVLLSLPPLMVLAFAVAVLAAGLHYSDPLFETRWLAWIGFAAVPPRSSDYVPFFPWFAAFAAGIGVVRLLVSSGLIRLLRGRVDANGFLPRLGRRSLAFYLLHQPVLIALLWIFAQIVPPPPPDMARAWMRDCVAGCLPGQSEAFCTAFCSCTLNDLQSKALFEPLLKGAIDPATDADINGIALQCTQTATEATSAAGSN